MATANKRVCLIRQAGENSQAKGETPYPMRRLVLWNLDSERVGPVLREIVGVCAVACCMGMVEAGNLNNQHCIA